MTLPQFIGTALLGDAAITAIVGDRIFFGRRPQVDPSDPLAGFPVINYYNITETQFVSAIVGTYVYQISARTAGRATDAELECWELSDLIGASLVNSAPRSEAGVDVQSIEAGPRALLFEPDIEAVHIPLTLQFVVTNTLV